MLAALAMPVTSVPLVTLETLAPMELQEPVALVVQQEHLVTLETLANKAVPAAVAAVVVHMMTL